MKKVLLFSASILAMTGALLVGSASAADLPDLEPVVVEHHDWSGLYFGGHAGYGFGDSDWTFVNTGVSISPNIDGFVGGGHLGWNFQNGSWVFGAEGDISYSDIDGSDPCPNPAFSCQLDVDFLASIRGRAGITVGPFLPFVTAGVAFGSVDPIAAQAGNNFDASSKTHVGYVVGGGVEHWTFMNDRYKISTRIEALYYDLGRKTYNLTNVGGGINASGAVGSSDPARIDVEVVVVRGGVSFHF